MADPRELPPLHAPVPAQAPVQRAPVQKKAEPSRPHVQLKRGLQMMGFDQQSALLGFDSPQGAPVQRAGGGENTDQVHEAAAMGIASGGGAMPHASAIQNSFGAHDVSGIQAHTGSAATAANQAMGAEAYATGNHVAFGTTPDLHTAAHEAAHVIQQQHGVSLGGGVGQVGDSYEQHADQVADAVVKGESAEPILSKMTGGQPAGGGTQQKATQQKAVQRMEAVQRVVPPVTPPATPPRTPPAPPTPPTPWQLHIESLPADVKTPCTAIADPATQTKLMTISTTQKRLYFRLTTAKPIYLGDDAKRPTIDAMAATADHLTYFETIATAPAGAAWLALTPNERTDILKITDPAIRVATMTDPAKLAQWNASRVSAEPNLASNRPLAAALINATGNPLTELTAICVGQAGENLRRIAADPGFRNAATPVDFVNELRTNILADTAKSAWDHMKALRRAPYILAGTETPISDAVVPDLCKAIPILNIISYNSPGASLKSRIMTANDTAPDYPTRDVTDPATGATTKTKITPPADAYDALGDKKDRFIEAYLRGGGAFAVTDVGALDAVQITGGGGIAYWTADAAGAPISALKGYDLATLRQKLAIEETAAYNTGAVVVNLKKTITKTAKGMAPTCFRPTAIDGLGFTQFDLAPAGSFAGVTSGGMGEVMIPAVWFSDAESITYVR